jgi:hypothetical protein
VANALGEFAEIKGSEPGDIDACSQRIGIGGEPPNHFLRAFERAIGINPAPVAKLVDGAIFAHRGDHVLEQAGRSMR